jgi:hypothetical protein
MASWESSIRRMLGDPNEDQPVEKEIEKQPKPSLGGG